MKVELSVSLNRIADRQQTDLAALMGRLSAQDATIAELKEMLSIALGDRENIPPPRSRGSGRPALMERPIFAEVRAPPPHSSLNNQRDQGQAPDGMNEASSEMQN
ncbi:hypothetical protein BGZ98_004426 [Dissophora globulifera]|nr:hypothetical protein BGZ98_004426 [Dissophora globulifera]